VHPKADETPLTIHTVKSMSSQHILVVRVVNRSGLLLFRSVDCDYYESIVGTVLGLLGPSAGIYCPVLVGFPAGETHMHNKWPLGAFCFCWDLLCLWVSPGNLTLLTVCPSFFHDENQEGVNEVTHQVEESSTLSLALHGSCTFSPSECWTYRFRTN
jgi:hypothetical protein